MAMKHLFPALLALLLITAAPTFAQSIGEEQSEEEALAEDDNGVGVNTPGNYMHQQMNGPQLLRLMEELGTDPTLDRDGVGDPMIEAFNGGVEYTVFFYDCDDAKRRSCQSLLFYFGISLDGGTSAAEMNTWNAESRFTRAYMDEVGDPILEMDVVLYGGLSETAIAERLRRPCDDFALGVDVITMRVPTLLRYRNPHTRS